MGATRWSAAAAAVTALVLAHLAAMAVPPDLLDAGAQAGRRHRARVTARPGPRPAHAPGLGGIGGITFRRHVYLKASQQIEHGIGHELVHVRQQAAHPVWFWVSYALLPRWRLRWEAEAYAVHARARCPIDGAHGLAAYLSGPAYLWISSQAQAGAVIRRFL